MKNTFSHYLLVVAIVFLSCTNYSYEKQNVFKKRLGASASTKVKQPVIINIIPYDDVPLGLTNHIFKEFTKIYPNTRLLKPVPLPRSAYYTARNRYRGDSLIRQLSAITATNHITLTLTTKNISTTKGKFADWGIMGLSYCLEKPVLLLSSVLKIIKNNSSKSQFMNWVTHRGLNIVPRKIVSCTMLKAEILLTRKLSFVQSLRKS